MNKLLLLLVPIFVIILASCGSGGGSSSSSPLIPSSPPASGFTATWAASPELDVVSYRIDYGPAIGDHSAGSFNVAGAATTTYTSQALSAGYYCFVVVAIDDAGNVSPESDEDCKDVT